MIMNDVVRSSCVPSLCCLLVAIGVLLESAISAFPQSIGFNFTTNGTWAGLYDNGEGVSLAPSEVAGLVPQAYWNNVGYKGSVNPGVVTNSAGNPVSLNLQWSSSYAYSAYGANAPYGTPDGLLMSGFIGTDYPSAPTNALGNSVYNSPGTDLPLIYVSGMNGMVYQHRRRGIPNRGLYNRLVLLRDQRLLDSIRHGQPIQQHDERRGGFDFD